jgi:hypothetical protein
MDAANRPKIAEAAAKIVAAAAVTIAVSRPKMNVAARVIAVADRAPHRSPNQASIEEFPCL